MSRTAVIARRLVLGALMFVGLSSAPTFSQTILAPAPPDIIRRDFEKIVTELQEAWNAGNGQAWAAKYAPDAFMINTFGVLVRNSDGIQSTQQQLFQGPLRGSRLHVSVRDIRMLNGSNAVMETDVDIIQITSMLPGISFIDFGTLHTRMLFTLTRFATGWVIVSSSQTITTPSPV